jgi:hypothetical protein
MSSAIPRTEIAAWMRQTFDASGDIWFQRAADALAQGWLPAAGFEILDMAFRR